MADQNLNIQVSATATGDGLRNTAEEVKNLNAETAKSAPLALEAKTREEQLAAVRERHAAAAREQAAAEAELDAKRAASPFFNGSAGAGGAGATGSSAADEKMGRQIGAIVGAQAAQGISEVVSYVDEMTRKLDEQRVILQKQSEELRQQVEIWGDMAKGAQNTTDVIKLMESIEASQTAIREKAAQAPAEAGSYLDRITDNLKMIGVMLNPGSVTEYSFEKKEREAEEQRAKTARAAETTAQNQTRQAIAAAEKQMEIEALPAQERRDRLEQEKMLMEDALADMESKAGKYSAPWREQYLAIEAVRKQLAAASKEQESIEEKARKAERIKQREGELLDANMRKEGDRFRREEATRERDGRALDDNMAKEGQKFLQAEAREREKEIRERQREQERDARDRARIEDEESRYRTKHNIPPPGFLGGAGAPASRGGTGRGAGGGLSSGGLTSGGLTSGGGATDFASIFQSVPAAAADSQAAAQSLAEAARQIVAMMASKMRADAETAAKLKAAVTQANINS